MTLEVTKNIVIHRADAIIGTLIDGEERLHTITTVRPTIIPRVEWR